ncbi:hypothetical protein QOT17_005816 [Balamuthia mandrillaris]
MPQLCDAVFTSSYFGTLGPIGFKQSGGGPIPRRGELSGGMAGRRTFRTALPQKPKERGGHPRGILWAGRAGLSGEGRIGPVCGLSECDLEVGGARTREEPQLDHFGLLGEAVLRYTFEDLSEDRIVNMSNGNTTRTLNFKKGGVKFTISFDNYSPLLFNITEEPDRYFGITTLNRFLLSRPVTNTSELGVFNLDDVPSAYQIPLAIRTKDEPILKASFALTMFSLQDPPSASRELLHPPEWGFENVDAVQRDLYYVNGEIHGQYIELIFAGARSVFYDPDLSILLGSSEEEQAEEGRDADDGEDVTLPVALSITAVAVIAILAVLGGFMWRRYYRRCRRSVAAESSVNF